MHNCNDKACFLMLNFAHYTLCQHKTDPVSGKSMLEGSVINKQ